MSLLESIYAKLPPALQDLAVTAQGAVYHSQRFGGVFREEYALLKAIEQSSALQLELLQVARLKRILAHAADNVPHYRTRISKALAKSMRAGDWSPFQQLPITEKVMLRESPLSFLSKPRPERNWIRWSTSGTTGTPMTLFYARDAVARQYAYVERYREQAGVSRFERRAQFTGKLIAPGDSPKRYWRYDWANRALLLSTVHLTAVNIPAYLDAIREFAPAYLTGYPSAIALLAQHALRKRDIRIPTVLTSAETLLPSQRDVIEAGFGAKVYDQYGQTEMQSFWFECRYQRMHAHPLFGVTEILRPDGSPCAAGEVGDVVLTGLINTAMPLIRYRVGDRAAWSNEDRCPCGRHMPMIETIEGRREDYLFSPARGWVGRLDPVLKGIEGVLECQFVQREQNRVEAYCVVSGRFDQLEMLKLERNLQDRLGSAMQVEFHFVPQIVRGANGKFRAVVCLLPREFQPQIRLEEVPR